MTPEYLADLAALEDDGGCFFLSMAAAAANRLHLAKIA